MAALMLVTPPEVVRVLRNVTVPGKPVQDHHVTVVYLGDDIPVEDIGGMLPALYKVASSTQPFPIFTSWVSTFPEGDDGIPVIARVFSPELHALKERLCDAITDAGFEYDNKFPVYKPHVTLTYAGKEAKDLDFEIPNITWTAGSILLWGANRGTGKLVVDLPFSLGEGDMHRARVKLAQWSRHSATV